MIIDFAADFADLLEDWTLTTTSPGAVGDYGQWVPGGDVVSTIQAVPPQPLNENEWQQQEGGEYTSSLEKTYSTTAVSNGDKLSFDGIDYEVHQSVTRARLGGFHKLILRRIVGDS